jgi:hypothetical protein
LGETLLLVFRVRLRTPWCVSHALHPNSVTCRTDGPPPGARPTSAPCRIRSSCVAQCGSGPRTGSRNLCTANVTSSSVPHASPTSRAIAFKSTPTNVEMPTFAAHSNCVATSVCTADSDSSPGSLLRGFSHTYLCETAHPGERRATTCLLATRSHFRLFALDAGALDQACSKSVDHHRSANM